MLPMPIDLAFLRTLLSYAVPLLFLLGAFAAGRGRVPIAAAWLRAQAAATAAAVVALAAFGAALVGEGSWQAAHAVVLVLVGFLGWVLTRYAANYLSGEPGQTRFVRWLLATLAGSSLVVASSNLGVLLIAWFATSMSLQNLLLFYPDRTAAQMAAHKKFLVSRAADLCVVGAAVLLALRFQTLDIRAIEAQVAAAPDLGISTQVAVILFAVAALLKCAQLPFHGWLMQVMEAPTPVSALLHAGVVNLGGFVLLRLQVLVGAVPLAQSLLVVVGSITAAVAALVASTRISIKVALAWSTCAQMGFMVLQCGLGLWEMALLHLIAHSLYKANAFLSAGTAVHQATVKSLSPAAATTGPVRRALAATVAAALVVAAGWLWSVPFAEQPGLFAMAFVVALALTPLLADGGLLRLVLPLAVALAYFGLHRGLHAWFGQPAPASAAIPWLAAWTALCFALVFGLQALVAARPNGAAARRLHAFFYGGLHLDEWFTRLTLRVWPIRRPPAHPASAAANQPRI
jgi:NAD(P)H-quinone oxidoreductase subunit 5